MSNPTLQKNEIKLRELFSIIWNYKWSIIFFSFLITSAVAIKVYLMPKYYKSTVTIEVKPDDNKVGGFSMGGAASLLLGGGSTGTTNLEKDITLLKTYRTNEKVLNKVEGYMIRYYVMDQDHKELEIDNKLSIKVTDVNIKNFKQYGMRLIVEPINNTEYKLLKPGRFSNDSLGNYHYSEMVHHDDFSLMIHKEQDFNSTYTIQLSGEKRYVFEKIIQKNLTIQADKKSPFITLSYLDTIPHRGEKYLENLISIYTKQSISDIKKDTSITINSYDKQLQKVADRVNASAKSLEKFKTDNNIVAPKLQVATLVQELSEVEIEIAKSNYKKELLNNLIKFTQNNENIDAIAPSLIELQDEPTISLIKLIQTQQLSLANLLIRYKPNHPNIIRADQTIYNLKEKVLANLKNLKITLANKNISLKNMRNAYQEKLKSSPKQEQELINFSRDYRVNEKMYLYLMQERSSAQLSHDKTLSRFKVIENIYTSKQAVKPKKMLIVIVTFFSAIIFMTFIAFFRKFIKKD
ncbi:MAG: Unknown protein [uncultured Sulfurovum sp.]|uniref:Tyrosine-protein kinase Wzc (EC) n=1 Tax=uncultured Sulfurovum sp. TaxID=269237 RepID=A0A6S6T4T7_9BACT|nr:MAG: Unknown protein [uncultured Sulfurovum sp.]